MKQEERSNAPTEKTGSDLGNAHDSPVYTHFSREEWARLSDGRSFALSEDELTSLAGLNEQVSAKEVAQIYLPMVRLLELYISASRELFAATSTFLRHGYAKAPYIIGLAGSVAVGKSTTARILRWLLSRAGENLRVVLVPTDGFLLPNRVLLQRGLMDRKGFPESYDLPRLIQFLSDIKSGRPSVAVPTYSHVRYDVLPDVMEIERPDVVIVEGLNLFQTPHPSISRVFVSDFFDFSIYLDADEQLIRRWYIERFLMLCDTVFQEPQSYFHRYASLSRPEAVTVAEDLWNRINGPNLHENILPTRERAMLVLRKGPQHLIEGVDLRKV